MTARDVRSDGAAAAVWLDAPSLDGLRTAAIGSFRCDDAASGARLLRDTCDKLRREGIEAVIGPMDGDTWAAHRLVVDGDGRPPFFLEPRNPSFYPTAFEYADFSVVAWYQSAVRPTAPAGEKPGLPGLTFRFFDAANAEADLRRLHALSLVAFADNAFYRPITAERFLASYTPILPRLDPELVLLAQDEAGELQGFLFAIPDLEQGPHPTSVILKTYASRVAGLGSRLAARFHALAHGKGYATVVHALMHETNLSSRHSENVGAHVFRRYALYGRRL